jgi:hypothetical protein
MKTGMQARTRLSYIATIAATARMERANPEDPIRDAQDGTAHTTTYKRQERHRMHYATLFCVKNIDAVKRCGLWIYEVEVISRRD